MGNTEDGERVLLSVALGMSESFEDWQAFGRDLISRGLGVLVLIVADGAPGLIKPIEQWRPANRSRNTPEPSLRPRSHDPSRSKNPHARFGYR